MIKKTSIQDYEFLANLEKECFPAESWNLNQILSHHQSQSSFVYFQENNLQNPVAYLFFIENSFELEILRIGVSPKFRRLGIADKLIAFLGTYAKEREIILEVK